MLALLTLLHVAATADVMPPNWKTVAYDVEISNLDEHPDHVFLIYPTSNHGFAYVFDPDVGMTGLMLREGQRGSGTSLYAYPRAAFEAKNPAPSRHPHGDNDELLTVVTLPYGALQAEATFSRPDLYPASSDVDRIERSYRIASLDDGAFVLELTAAHAITVDGERQPLAVERAHLGP